MNATMYGGQMNVPGAPGNNRALRQQAGEEEGSNAGLAGQYLGGAVGSSIGSSPYGTIHQENMAQPGEEIAVDPRQQRDKVIPNTQLGSAGGLMQQPGGAMGMGVGNAGGMQMNPPAGFQRKIVS